MKTLLLLVVVARAVTANPGPAPVQSGWDMPDAGPDAGVTAPEALQLKDGELIVPTVKTVTPTVGEGALQVKSDETIALGTQDNPVLVAVDGLLNRHRRGGGLKLTMGQAEVFVTGQFSRDEKVGYLMLDSKRFRNPIAFNLMGLLDNEVEVSLGGTAYKMWLDVSVRGKMSSKVKIKGGGEEHSFTLGQIFETTYFLGHAITLRGTEHRVFHLTDFTGQLQAQADGKRTYVLLSRDPSDHEQYYPYQIPEERLPADGSEIILSYKDKPIKTLKAALKDGKLSVRRVD